MKPQKPSGLDIQTRIIGRAATDAKFRKQLLASGRKAIEQELGIKLPLDLEIQVIEETPSRLCLVIPMKQEPKKKLSEAELKGVVAGSLPVPIPIPVANLPGPLPMPVATMPGPMPMPVSSFERLSIYTIKR